MDTDQARHPRGTPTGGRFAPDAHSEGEVSLEDWALDSGYTRHDDGGWEDEHGNPMEMRFIAEQRVHAEAAAEPPWSEDDWPFAAVEQAAQDRRDAVERHAQAIEVAAAHATLRHFPGATAVVCRVDPPSEADSPVRFDRVTVLEVHQGDGSVASVYPAETRFSAAADGEGAADRIGDLHRDLVRDSVLDDWAEIRQPHSTRPQGLPARQEFLLEIDFDGPEPRAVYRPPTERGAPTDLSERGRPTFTDPVGEARVTAAVRRIS